MARRRNLSLARASALSAAALLWAAVADAAPGDLDSSFGEGGITSVAASLPSSGRGPAATGIALQPDGKVIVVAGSATGDMLVQRFAADGEPDAGFGVGGTVTLDLGATEGASAVAVRPDGRIVVAGTSAVQTGARIPRAALVRLSAAGELDASFGSGASS